MQILAQGKTIFGSAVSMEHNFVKDEGGTDYQIMDLETIHHSTNLFVLFYHYVGALNR